MSRIRSVHPGLFTDEAFVSLSSDAQVFYIGLWTEADDQGVFEWKPATLRMKLRGIKDGPVEPLLAELVAANCICSYEIEGRKFGAVRNFRKYQRPKSPNSLHPTTPEIRKYVYLSRDISEIGRDDVPRIPPKGEKPPQMEDGGGRKKEEGKKEPASQDGEPPSLEAEVFRRGKSLLGKNSGGQITKLRQAFPRDDRAVLALLNEAKAKENPAEWVAGVLRRHESKSPTDELGLPTTPIEDLGRETDALYARLGVVD